MEASLQNRNFRRLILLTFILWTLFGIMAAFQSYANTMDERSSFPLERLLYLTVGDAWLRAALTVPVIMALFHVHARFNRWAPRVAIYLLMGFAFMIAHVTVRPFVLPFVVRPMANAKTLEYTYKEKVTIAIRSFVLNDAMGFTCIVIAFNAWVYAQEMQRRALNEERLATRLASAELQVLKMQLQPHFLFNTLNTIYNLAPQNSRKAQLMISRLSNLLRLSLDHVSSNMVPLQEELEFLDSYLDIEKTRFEERLKVIKEVTPEVLDAAVPNLLLQPLVENAIRHGISKKASGGTIEIRAARIGDRLKITITDDGRPPAPSAHSSGIGLANTRARLSQLFGSDFVFELRPAGQGAQVWIELPFQSLETNITKEESVG
ncbi:MAG TPA: histidine kinase [Terriglobales bacterium]|nr:histidine kinase [Terriglobales bacterium]